MSFSVRSGGIVPILVVVVVVSLVVVVIILIDSKSLVLMQTYIYIKTYLTIIIEKFMLIHYYTIHCKHTY